ncbi:hypothetical protein IT418_02775, partial [bacterium]|nr:hypothetical protein [bacterium]
MRLLHKRQYYLDRYDLSTIKSCFMVFNVRDTMYKDKKLQRKYPNGKHMYEVDKFIHRQMFLTKAHEYQHKEKTIDKWIDRDKKIQKKYDCAVSPIIKCVQCGRQLKELDKSFEGCNSLTDRISFTLICDDCRVVKRVYEDGSEVVQVPDRCVRCNSIVNVDRTFTGDITKSSYKCNKCGYESSEEYNDKDFMQQFEDEKKKDKKLLEKYRSEFCLNQEEGEKAVDVLEQVKFAQEVYEYEIEKYKGDEKERIFNIKR